MFYTIKFKIPYLDCWKGRLLSVAMASALVLVVLFWSLSHGFLPRALSERMPEILIESLGVPPVGVANATKLYGIMFDAGSTGSRIHVYKFFRNKEGSLDLEGEVFEQLKPGLSSYADDPVKGAESLKPLLEIAKKTIPEMKWKSTPVALKATAGLRLLPKEKSEALLTEVTRYIKSYPFSLIDDGVAIMDGTDEGLFSWVTLNFLLGRINNIDSTHGMMDLGGGSTQITFYPTVSETRGSMQEDFKVNFQHKKEQVTLYTHSYLGLGLMSARKGIFGGSKDDKSLSSLCLPSNHQGKWKFGGENYDVRAKWIADKDRFDSCYNLAKAAVGTSVRVEKEVDQVPFYIFSYYYDRAVDAKLIDELTGGSLRVKQFKEAAHNECDKPSKEEPFLCMDLCYISALLQNGFGFADDTVIRMKKKIKGVETAWCLGAMFNVMNQLEGNS
ncbi:ectonucleoside triphosphate diphosphohydrolase 5-like [Lineus longissimus]|uniref:ectonucleoside triphosphate diphosphohydrolase 5-like n=1 Tax=Lineus longissimus TaxID=88925 RepID=UPI002B4EDE4D